MKILYFTPSIGNGGVEKMLYEWMARLSKLEKYSFDIITNEIISNKYYKLFGDFVDNIYEMAYHPLRLDKKVPILIKILRKGNYDVFHVHSCFAFDFWMLAVAKHLNIKTRIIHSHNTHVVFRLKATEYLDKLSKPLLRYYATDFMACGKEAGISLLGDKKQVKDNLVIMENGIDVYNYIPNEAVRKEVREELNISCCHVLGSVGRLEQQKNYSFLLKVFKEVRRLDEKFVLILIGSGTEEEALKKQTKDLKIEDYVIFMGEREDVPRLLQGLDVFVLTSLYEGLVISMVEAQCSGLPCIASNKIPQEVNLTKRVMFLGLDQSVDIWARNIKELLDIQRNLVAYKDIIEAGYDINTSTKKLADIYKNRIDI